MFIAKDLLIKGMLGAGLCVGTGVAGICYREDIKRLVKSGVTDNKVEPKEDKDWIKAVGLSCGETFNSTGADCTILEKNLNVKWDATSKNEGLSSSGTVASPKGKIKVYKENENSGYKNNLKFAIEGGDVNLDGSSKLEEFETYQIEEVVEGEKKTKKYFLSRKEKSIDVKRRLLGLPEGCKLPETTDASVSTPTCEIAKDNIKNINFDGKSGEPTVTNGGKLQVTITKLASGDDFTDGYKFSLTANGGDVTINRTDSNDPITIKTNSSEEFKIKKQDKSLSLEKAWDINTLTKKVGLKCGTDNSCSIEDEGLNVKWDDNNKSEKNKKQTSTSSSGKIKLYKKTSGYNQEFKFVIEEGDIALSDSKVTKLEEFETYEIKEENNKWYLSRKKTSKEEKERILGLPSDCHLPNGSSNCSSVTLDEGKLKAINFEGKNTSGVTIADSGSTTLTITKTTDTTTFKDGYKFSFQPNKKVTISNSVSIEENTKTDFKIKKSGTNLTLEKAWTLDKLAEKVGLENCNNDTCSIKDGSFNFKQDNTKEENKKKSTSSGSGKIKVYKDDKGKGYENGFKFVIEEGDISIGDSTSNKLEEFETYEIKEETNKWYLTRKDKAAKGIEKALGLPTDCQLPDSGEKTCDNLDADKLKNINFEGKKEGSSVTLNGNSGTVKLKIKKETDTTKYPLGYKFTFETDKDISIPKSSSGTINIKKKTNTEFKIKKNTSDSKKLSLEKTWDITKLSEKVGLKECSNGQCSFTENKINVHNGNSDKVENAKVKNDNNNSKKISYTEDQEDYNQGFKFTVTEDIELEKNGGSSGDTSVKILKGNGSDTSYEIKQDGGKWYLYKKSSK